MSLHDFLKENVAEMSEREVVVSDRFPPFRIRALGADEDETIRVSCTVRVPDGCGGSFPECDPNRYLSAIAAASVVHPDLDDASLQNSYGVLGRERLLLKMLTKSEFDTLCAAITKEGFADLVEKAKN